MSFISFQGLLSTLGRCLAFCFLFSLGWVNAEPVGAAEPKTVLDAVVRQLEENERLSDASLSESSSDKTGDGISKFITSELGKVVDEAEVEDTAERLARQKARLADVVHEAVQENALERLAGRQSKDDVLKQKPSKPAEVSQRKNQNGIKKELTQGEMLTANFIVRSRINHSNQSNSDQKSGWVYLGHFVRNDWLSKTLDIKKSLPKIGRKYTVMQTLNMRVEAPSKAGGSSQLIKRLKRDDSVKILKVRPSGRNGHYWAQVEYQ